MTFLDADKGVFILGGKEYKPSENVKGIEIQQIRQLMSDAEKADFTTENEIKWEKKIFGKSLELCFPGQGLTWDTLLELLSMAEAREFIAEVYSFLVSFGTIEKAKLSGVYSGKMKDSNEKQDNNSQN